MRSGYLMCPICGNVYYSNMIAPTFSGGEAELVCPNYDCLGGELFKIDELMIKAAQKLNELGYKISYCSSGHHASGVLFKDDRRISVIMFRQLYKFDTMPEGWYDDTHGDHVYKRINATIIRSSCESLAARIENLEKWVMTLEPYKEDES